MPQEVGGEIKWTFVADDSQLNAKLAAARKNIKKSNQQVKDDLDRTFTQSADQLSQRFTRVGSTLTNIGSTFTKAVTLPIVAGFYGIAKAGINFESSFAGVRKTVDATEAEFADLEKRFRNIALNTPIDVNSLNRIGELAGQLGVSGVDNLEKFTKAIADISVTTNLTEESASTSFARIANIMQEPIENVDRMGSSVVDLGNNFATTESEIVEFANRIAGAGKTAGLTTADIFGISTAFSSVGVQAERGGTAVSKVLFRMAEAVASGNEDLTKFAEVAGTAAGDFAEAFSSDPIRAFDQFVSGLGQAGIGATGFLDELELGDERLRQSFISVAGAGGIMTDAIDTATQAWDENTALVIEADKRYGTVESKIQVAKNRLYDLGITLSETLLPPFIEVIERLSGVVDGFKELSPETQKLILKVAGAAAVFGPLVLVAGQFATAIGALLTPVGLVIAVLVAFVVQVAFTVRQVKKSLDQLSEFATIAFDKIKQVFSDPADLIRGFFDIPDQIDGIMGRVAEKVIGTLSDIRSQLPNIKDNIVNFFNDLPENFEAIFELVKERVGVALSNFGDVAQIAIDAMLDEFRNFPQQVADRLKSIGNTIVTTWTLTQDIVTYIVTDFLPDVWNAAKNAVVSIVSNIGSDIGRAIVVGLETAAVGAGAGAAIIVNAISSGFNTAISSIGSFTGQITGAISEEFNRFKESAPGQFGPVGDAIIEAIYGRIDDNIGSIGSIINDAILSATPSVLAFDEALQNTSKVVGDSMIDAGHAVTDFAILANEKLQGFSDFVGETMINAGGAVNDFVINGIIDFQKWIDDTLLSVGQWSINLQESVSTAFTNLTTGEDGGGFMDRTLGAWSDSLLNWFQELPGRITEWVTTFGQSEETGMAWGEAGADGVVNFFDGINAERESLILKIGKFLGYVVLGVIALAVTEFINLGLILIGGLVTGLISARQWVIDTMKDNIAYSITVAVDFGKLLYDSGRDIITGLLDGLKSKAQAVYDFLAELANKAKDTFTGILSIESPSKVFMGFGENIVEGLAKGIDATAGLAEVSSQRLADKVATPATQQTNNNNNVQNTNSTINNTFIIDSDERMRSIEKYMEQKEVRNKFGFSS